jgi:hypothetical protein
MNRVGSFQFPYLGRFGFLLTCYQRRKVTKVKPRYHGT